MRPMCISDELLVGAPDAGGSQTALGGGLLSLQRLQVETNISLLLASKIRD